VKGNLIIRIHRDINNTTTKDNTVFRTLVKTFFLLIFISFRLSGLSTLPHGIYISVIKHVAITSNSFNQLTIRTETILCITTPPKNVLLIFFSVNCELQRKAESKEREKRKFWTQIYADKLRYTQKLKSRCQRHKEI
jgi:hypothetical protein